MVSKLTKNPENRSTGMAVTGPTKVATCTEKEESPVRWPEQNKNELALSSDVLTFGEENSL